MWCQGLSQGQSSETSVCRCCASSEPRIKVGIEKTCRIKGNRTTSERSRNGPRCREQATLCMIGSQTRVRLNNSGFVSAGKAFTT
jgi:hypothetical protein